jgi:HSP20 family protein
MNREPMDMFEEMDEIFSRLFSRVDREFMTGSPQVYGYRIMVMDGGEPQGMPGVPDDAALMPCATGEPPVEVHHTGNEVKVITELPGITDDTLRLHVQGNTLVIDAGDADQHYRSSVALPPVDTGSMRKSLRNGVLEVTFTTLPDAPNS